jgi:hypothetical protein
VRAMRLSARSDAMDTSNTARFNSTDHAEVCPATSRGVRCRNTFATRTSTNDRRRM